MASLHMVQRYATLVSSSEGGITPPPHCCAVCQGASIRPELDQFWCTFLLTYLLLNLDKKHTTTTTLPRIPARPVDAGSCALAAFSESEVHKP
jgi:hypothetical protein